MSLQELITQILQVDLDGLSTFIGANAAFLKSIEFGKVVTELIIPWMKAKAIPEEQHEAIIQEVGRIIKASLDDRINFKSVVQPEVV